MKLYFFNTKKRKRYLIIPPLLPFYLVMLEKLRKKVGCTS